MVTPLILPCILSATGYSDAATMYSQSMSLCLWRSVFVHTNVTMLSRCPVCFSAPWLYYPTVPSHSFFATATCAVCAHTKA